MANIKVKSGASGTADGSSWANAKVDFVAAASADAAGDVFEVSQAHNESTVAAINVAVAGTIITPSKIIGVNDASETPTTVSDTATVSSNGNIILTGSFHCSGIIFIAGNTATGSQSILLGNAAATQNQVFEKCSMRLAATTTGSALIQIGDDSRTDVHRYCFQNTTVKFGGANHRIKINSNFKWDGGSVLAGTATPTSIFSSGLRCLGDVTVNSVDFSQVGATANIFAQAATGSAFTFKIRNCILPASGNGTAWSGSLWSALPTLPGYRAEMYNCSAGATKYRVWVGDAMGQARDETTVVRTSGATDDGVAYSLKMISSTVAEYPAMPLESTPICTYVDTSGSPVTLSVEIVHDSQGSGTGAALQDDEFGLRVVYPGGFSHTFKADVLATPVVAGVTSSEAWTTTGLTSPVKQKISVTFTPTSKGQVVITPVLYATSKTVYVCPKLGA